MRYKDRNGESGNRPTCVMCGSRPADVAWKGAAGQVDLCALCATCSDGTQSSLGVLIGEAASILLDSERLVSGQASSDKVVQGVLGRVEGGMWRALALQQERALNKIGYRALDTAEPILRRVLEGENSTEVEEETQSKQ